MRELWFLKKKVHSVISVCIRLQKLNNLFESRCSINKCLYYKWFLNIKTNSATLKRMLVENLTFKLRHLFDPQIDEGGFYRPVI